jgi:hypothetical protein
MQWIMRDCDIVGEPSTGGAVVDWGASCAEGIYSMKG